VSQYAHNMYHGYICQSQLHIHCIARTATVCSFDGPPPGILPQRPSNSPPINSRPPGCTPECKSVIRSRGACPQTRPRTSFGANPGDVACSDRHNGRRWLDAAQEWCHFRIHSVPSPLMRAHAPAPEWGWCWWQQPSATWAMHEAPTTTPPKRPCPVPVQYRNGGGEMGCD
jgi:hypothetical protein